MCAFTFTNAKCRQVNKIPGSDLRSLIPGQEPEGESDGVAGGVDAGDAHVEGDHGRHGRLGPAAQDQLLQHGLVPKVDIVLNSDLVVHCSPRIRSTVYSNTLSVFYKRHREILTSCVA